MSDNDYKLPLYCNNCEKHFVTELPQGIGWKYIGNLLGRPPDPKNITIERTDGKAIKCPKCGVETSIQLQRDSPPIQHLADTVCVG